MAEAIALSLRTIGILLLALVAAVALAVWLQAPSELHDVEPGAGGRLLPEETSEIRIIEIERAGQTTRLQHFPRRGWQVVSPTTAPADPQRVAAFLQAVRQCRVAAIVEREAARLQPFGLAEPRSTLRIFGAGGRPVRVLSVGNRSPVGPERYVASDDGAVLLVDGAIAEILDTDAGQFVERRFVPIPPEQIASLDLERNGRVLGLRRSESGWRLTAPLEDLADVRAAESMALAATQLVVERPVDRAEIDPHGHGLSEALILEVGVAGGGELIELEIGGRASRTRLYACRLGERGMCGTVDAARVLELMKDPEELRARRLAIFSRSEVRGVRLVSPDEVLSALRSGPTGPWRVTSSSEEESRPASAERVTELLDRLQRLRAASFAPVSSGGGGASRELVIEGQDGELGRLFIDASVVRSTWRPGLRFEVDARDLDDLLTSADALLDPPGVPSDEIDRG